MLLAISIAFVVGVFGITLVLATSAGSPSFGDGPPSDGTSLKDFETSLPDCRDTLPEKDHASSMPYKGGTRLKIAATVPVGARDAIIDASFDRLGPKRYWLNIDRSTRRTSNSCQLAVRVNATILLAESSQYTVLLTLDGDFIGTYWRDADASGSFHRSHDPAPLAPRTAANKTSPAD